MPAQQLEFADDSDSLHVLPLKIIPLETQSLRDARMTKNAHLESVVELFTDKQAGCGQVYPKHLGQFFDFSGSREKDFKVILALADLPSFDVFSLRIELRELGIDVDKSEHLRLSRDMEASLSGYITTFTQPLMAQIYGDDSDEERKFSDIVKLFANPDVGKARQNLMDLAEKLEIELLEIPRFLARYGDVYLSLAYYNYCLDLIQPAIREFLAVSRALRENPHYKFEHDLIDACSRIEERLTGAELSISQILEIFQIQTEDMWKSIDRQRFRSMEQNIVHYQRDIGGSICAMTIKMNSWDMLKGKNLAQNQASFIMSDMVHGIEHVTEVTFQDTKDRFIRH